MTRWSNELSLRFGSVESLLKEEKHKEFRYWGFFGHDLLCLKTKLPAFESNACVEDLG